jgi:hypothetical protein
MGAKPGLRRTALLGALAMVAMLSACSFANQNVRPSPEAPSVTSTSAQGKALPWKLIKVDHSDNRIYLSAAQVGCSIPKNVRLVETDSTITLTVIGSDSNGATPCTQQNRTMIGYVTPHSAIGARTVTGNR